mmetsp:Transcript_35513/g.77739  ORF Transcript_35513/g.77739 Transcript_35513/m.77739 type:complete len:246 (+) Transcript_35513:1501-2238(+)
MPPVSAAPTSCTSTWEPFFFFLPSLFFSRCSRCSSSLASTSSCRCFFKADCRLSRSTSILKARWPATKMTPPTRSEETLTSSDCTSCSAEWPSPSAVSAQAAILEPARPSVILQRICSQSLSGQRCPALLADVAEVLSSKERSMTAWQAPNHCGVISPSTKASTTTWTACCVSSQSMLPHAAGCHAELLCSCCSSWQRRRMRSCRSKALEPAAAPPGPISSMNLGSSPATSSACEPAKAASARRA